jgi:RNA polymerase sigma-70 factor (ECF subfamily)
MTEEASRPREEALVRRATSGDAEAFGELYVRHLEEIYRYVFYKVGNQKRAEDLTEQIFLNAWEAIDDYQLRGYPFSSWLYRIAHNAVVDYYRTKKDERPLDSVAFALADESPGPEETVMKKREVSRLLEALAQLSEERQELIILRFVEGLSHAQVAQILNKSEGACRVMQHRALASLSDILERSQ